MPKSITQLCKAILSRTKVFANQDMEECIETKNVDYDSKIKREVAFFKEYNDVHELPESFHYITNRTLTNNINKCLGFSTYDEMILDYVNRLKESKNEADISILSLGAGNCDYEINFACKNQLKCQFICYEINPQMLERGEKLANEKLGGNHNFVFTECDINKIKLDKTFDIILACHSLHHFVELEHIFDEVHNGMSESSFFIINDIIGRNGHMFWDSTLQMCNKIWSIFPNELKYNHLHKKYYPKRIQWDCSTDGFEGVRAQDILLLLDEKFKFKDFIPFFALVNKFIDRDFGHNFDLNNEYHKSLLDMIDELDNSLLTKKLMKPTQMYATLVKKNVDVTDYKYMYFEKPSEVYLLDESLVWNYFDSK